MGSAEKFCLRWNDFEANISSAFRELREDKDFFDVTLACDDDQVQAHKVILSACSPFFRTILKRNRHEHPLLYLKGVKYIDLVSVLNFMYHGEVNVAQEELNSFLAIAEELKVKGLTQNGGGGEKSHNPTPKSRDSREPAHQRMSAQAPALPAPKRPRPSPMPSFQQHQEPEVHEIEEVAMVKSEPGSLHGSGAQEHHQLVEQDFAESYEAYEGYEEDGEEGGYEGALMPSSGDANKGNASPPACAMFCPCVV